MSQRKCDICGRPAEDAYRPFCSRRCADVDLQRWLSNRYVVPAAAVEDDEREGEPLAPYDPDDD